MPLFSVYFVSYELYKIPNTNEITCNNYNPGRLPQQLLPPPPLPTGRSYTFGNDEGYRLDQNGLVVITFNEYNFLSWNSDQTQITPPYFQQGIAWVPVLQVASLLRHGSIDVKKQVPQFNGTKEHMSMELDLSLRLLEMLDKRVIWRQDGKEIRGTLSAFDPTREVFSNKMVWQATIQGSQPRQYQVLLSDIADGSVGIEHDAEEDTESDESGSGCGKTDIVGESSNDDGDMCN
jgi:small nuclear ribonucleoprotein (snRNP)-like protein